MRFHVNTQHSLGRFRLSAGRDAAADFETGRGASQFSCRRGRSAQGGRTLTDAQRSALRDWFAGRDPEWTKRRDALSAHLARQPARDLRPVMICSEGVPILNHHANGRGYPHFYPEVHFLERGDPKQRKGVAAPGFLQVLMPAGRMVRPGAVNRPRDQRRVSAAPRLPPG